MRHFVIRSIVLCLLLLAAHCSGAAASASDAGSAGNDAATPDAPDSALSPPLPDGGGAGSVSGSADGTPFATVATSYLAGAPDDPSTTVVFVFSKPVSCSELSSPGWDTRITNGTQFLEMKMFGQSPGAFTAVTTTTPAPGEASVNYTLSVMTGAPKESGSSGGTVTLTSLVASASAGGSFALDFGTNKLSGTFSAIFCPGGHEP